MLEKHVPCYLQITRSFPNRRLREVLLDLRK